MKMIVKIARTELKNLFYSPVAWFLTLVFMIVCGIFYAVLVEKVALVQELTIKNVPKRLEFERSFTEMIFLGPQGIFSKIMEYLYLFIPLLTMGVISREVNNGTVKLLYSSPVTVRQIVFGKYLALMIYNLLLLSIVGMFMVTGVLNITKADTGLLLSAMLGFYLMACAYTAIGLFMSSLSTYQIVSAIATFVLLFVLELIGNLWQQYDIVRDITYFLSIKGRTIKMLKGLITTRDVMYFILITGLFLVFTMLKLKSGRTLIPWYKNAVKYVSALALVIMIGYFTSRPGYIGYFDLTARKDNTINPVTQSILKSMKDEPVEITLYTNLLGGGVHRTRPEGRNDYIWNFWERYIRFKPDLKFNYVMYYDINEGDSNIFRRMPGKSLKEIAGESAKMMEANFSRFIEPEKIRKMIDLAPEKKRSVMQLKYKGRSIFLRTFDDPTFWPDEDHVAAAFKVLLEGKGPKVYQVTGNLERDIHKVGEREFQWHTLLKSNRGALINHGYAYDTLDLAYRDIPADADELVVADPKVMLNDTIIGRLRNYIRGGGNMLLLGEPGKQQVINPVIQQTGARLMPGTIVEVTNQEMPHMVYPYFTREYTYLMKRMDRYMNRMRKKLDMGDSSRLLYPGASAVSFADSGFTPKYVSVTSGRNAWVKVGKLVTDSAAPIFVAAEGDFKQDSFNVLLPLTRKIGNKEQRIIIAGDADFLSNIRNRSGVMSKFFHGWLNYEEFPISIIAESPMDVSLTISHNVALAQKYFYVWILPAAFLLLGTILLIRRKRQ
jgi:ABC-2 type transport system permease protein